MQPLTDQLEAFYRETTQNTTAFTPRHLFPELCRRSPRFRGGRQQDSHELLRHLMDGVKEEEKIKAGADLDLPYKELTIVDRVFGGHFLTVFNCSDCLVPYHLFEPFLDMSLPIAFVDTDADSDQSMKNVSEQEEAAPEEECKAAEDAHGNDEVAEDGAYKQPLKSEDDPVTKPERATIEPTGYQLAVEEISGRLAKPPTDVDKDSVLDSLRFYTRKEQLDEYLCLECNKGKNFDNFVKTRGTKETFVYNPPAILTIHLKRFEQTPRGYDKVCKHITFSQCLDLAPYCSVYSLRQQKTEHPSIRYSLYGVVVHHGSTLHGGHYTACVRVRTVDVGKTRAFLQEKFINREKLMDKNELINLVKMSRNDLHYLEVPGIDVSDAEYKWFGISDSSVYDNTESAVFAQEAYLLFYERAF